jgi:hypothetical protein
LFGLASEVTAKCQPIVSGTLAPLYNLPLAPLLSSNPPFPVSSLLPRNTHAAMERRRIRLSLMVAAAALLAAAGDAALSPDHYRSSCPDLESIVRYEVSRKINLTVVTIPATLRLVFHDCMVGVRKTQRTLPGLYQHLILAFTTDLAAASHPVPPMFDSVLPVQHRPVEFFPLSPSERPTDPAPLLSSSSHWSIALFCPPPPKRFLHHLAAARFISLQPPLVPSPRKKPMSFRQMVPIQNLTPPVPKARIV